MSGFAKFLSWCFGIAALLNAAAAAGALSVVLRPEYLRQLEHSGASALLVAAIVLLLFGSVAVFGMAWWTTRKGTASARLWAIAASVLSVLLGLGPAILSNVPKNANPSRIYGPPIWLLVAFGVVGLIVFSRRDAVPRAAAPAPKPRHLPGDGTSRVADAAVRVVEIGGTLGVLFFWFRWAGAVQLPSIGFVSFLLLVALAGFVSTAVHELGHAGAGWILGMKFRALVVWPFQWRVENGKWRFRFRPTGLAIGGGTGMVHADVTDRTWADVTMIAAGPAASLCLGLFAFWATAAAKGRPWAHDWELLALIATFSFIGCVASLIPVRTHTGYSDGAHIYQLVSGSPWIDVHRVFSLVSSGAVTPLRPKDYDIAAIERAARFLTHGRQAVLLRLFAYFHFLDCGQIPAATQALVEAESAYEPLFGDISAGVLAELVFGNAFVKRDTAGSRLWGDRMEAGKPHRDSATYWLARSALFRIENRMEEAREAWKEGNALAQQLPGAGAYEFERWRFGQLRQALDASSSPA